jgi:hypothetical protein
MRPGSPAVTMATDPTESSREEEKPMSHRAILLPGIVLPAELAYPALIEALGEGVEARAKELEVYASDRPGPDYGIETELAGILREAEVAGFERFHLVGYSGGGRDLGSIRGSNPGPPAEPRAARAGLGRQRGPQRARAAGTGGVRPNQRAAGGEADAALRRAPARPRRRAPPPPPGPTLPWMAKRPAGIRAPTGAFASYRLDLEALGAFPRPVYYALGGLSNPDYFGAMAERLGGLFDDHTLDVFEERHHFDHPHRAEPERLAARLLELWEREPAATG